MKINLTRCPSPEAYFTFILLICFSKEIFSQNSKLQIGLSFNIEGYSSISSSSFPLLSSNEDGSPSKFFRNFGVNAEIFCTSNLSIRYEAIPEEQYFNFFTGATHWRSAYITSDSKYLVQKIKPLWKINLKNPSKSTWFSVGLQSSLNLLQVYTYSQISPNNSLDTTYFLKSHEHHFANLSIIFLLSRESTFNSGRFIFYREIHFIPYPIITHESNVPSFYSPEIGVTLGISYRCLKRK